MGCSVLTLYELISSQHSGVFGSSLEWKSGEPGQLASWQPVYLDLQFSEEDIEFWKKSYACLLSPMWYNVSELCCMSMLKNQSLLLGTGSGGYNSEQCASFLSSIVKNNKGPLLTESAKVFLY